LVGKGLNDSNSRANPLEFPESEADFARQPGGFSGKCPGRRSNSARIAEISSSSAATGIAGLIEIIGRSPNLKKSDQKPKSRGVASMSESTATKQPEPAEPPVNPDEVFDKTQLKYFDAEDGHAGGVLGTMLSLFFFYTVIVMALVAVWTFAVVGE
jgi:hypothetical protein